jgi:hypothetical protein
MKNNKVTFCEGTPAEAWKMFLLMLEVLESLTKLFNIIRSKREFPREWNSALIQPICKGNGSQSLGTIEGFHYYQFWGNIEYIQEYNRLTS